MLCVATKSSLLAFKRFIICNVFVLSVIFAGFFENQFLTDIILLSESFV